MKIKYVCIMFKIIAFFIITLFSRLYVRVGGGVKSNETSLTPALQVPVPSKTSEWSCVCVLGVGVDLASF